MYSSSTRSIAGMQTEFPPPPRKAIDGPVEPVPPRRATDGQAEPPPPPQPRRPGTQNSSKALVVEADGIKVSSPPIDLLSDNEEVGLKGWEVLKPST